jgi:hypothetical protein
LNPPTRLIKPCYLLGGSGGKKAQVQNSLGRDENVKPCVVRKKGKQDEITAPVSNEKHRMAMTSGALH